MDENQPGPNPMSTLNQSIEDLLKMTTRLDENQPGSNQSIEDDLLNFLKNLNLEEHYMRLKDEDVDLETLFLCKNHGDLEQLGITKAGQRMRLLKAMEPGSVARALSTPSISPLQKEIIFLTTALTNTLPYIFCTSFFIFAIVFYI